CSAGPGWVPIDDDGRRSGFRGHHGRRARFRCGRGVGSCQERRGTMKTRFLRAGWLLAIGMAGGACAAPRILGKATIVDETGAPMPTPAAGVTVNFVNLGGALDESVVSVETDAKGKYRSPELKPGKYQVEAMLPGYVIGKSTVVLGKHGGKDTPFALRKIREAKGKSVKE